MRTMETAKGVAVKALPNPNRPKYSMGKLGSQLPLLPNDALHPVTYEDLYRNQKRLSERNVYATCKLSPKDVQFLEKVVKQ